MDAKTLARFEDKYVPEPNTGCWLWIAGVNKDGYGGFRADTRTWLAHRVSYEHFVGPIPEGLELDHLCRTRSCVNPNHLEPVIHIVNVRRGLNVGETNGAKTHPESIPRGDRHWTRALPERVARGERHSSKTHPELVLRGEQVGNAKLTTENVLAIRLAYKEGGETQTSLGNRFGVSPQHIYRIVTRKRWGHI